MSLNVSKAKAMTGEGRKGMHPLVIVLIGLGAFVAMGVPMLAMMYFMSQMNVHMGRMVDSVVQMAGDVGAMREDMDAMGRYLRSMNIGVVSMDNNIDDIEASIVAMDDSIYTINSAIQHIQSSMAADLKGTRTDVGQLNLAVQHMSGNVSGMHVQMDQMRRDIGYGTETFTQPWNLMRNLTPWQVPALA